MAVSPCRYITKKEKAGDNSGKLHFACLKETGLCDAPDLHFLLIQSREIYIIHYLSEAGNRNINAYSIYTIFLRALNRGFISIEQFESASDI
jgi:hypothetical protein